jgi:dTDP-4-amino-4,6-dideoxygalactose transaminase
LEYILRGLGDISKLYIPYFTCDVIIQPLKRLNISYIFYRINEDLEIESDIQLSDGEYILYTNYYGIKDAYVKHIAEKYGNKIIIDNAQALFCSEYTVHQFYSPRKFMGMPDGGMVVSNVDGFEDSLPIDKSYDRCSHLLKRHELIPSEGYLDFKENSHKIVDSPLSRMSNISRMILHSVDMEFIKQRRLANFSQLHWALKCHNKLSQLLGPDNLVYSVPLVYPFWTENDDLKQHLIQNNVFVATYWPNVFEWTKETDLEYQIAKHVVCIPIDQRYGEKDINRIINLICK